MLMYVDDVRETTMKKAAIPALILAVLLCPLHAQEKQDKPALFPFLKEGRVGYMDATGKTCIEPKFNTAWPFCGERTRTP